MEQQPVRRRRPALSCLTCRRRKIKCDRNDPCAHCVSAKAQCSYKVYGNEPVIRQQSQLGSSSGSTASSSSHAPSSSAAAGQIGTNGAVTEYASQTSGPQIAAETTAAAGGGQRDIPNTLSRNDTRSPNLTQDVEQNIQDLLQRIQKLEASSASSPVQGLAETGRGILARQSGLQDSQIILNKTRILGWSQWMGTAPEFAIVGACYAEAIGNGNGTSFQDAETRAVLVQVGDLLGKCKKIARSIKIGRPSRGLVYPESGFVPTSREVADKMVRLYFRSFESTHRILHEPTFWVEYQRYWDHPGSVTPDLRHMILLVIGIGSSLHDREETDAGFRSMVHQWVYAAQTWLSGPLEKDRLSITALQIYCLTLLARQIFSIGGDLVWMSTGSLIHRAMQIGLHRDPKHLPAMSVLQAELRRRLWATIFELVVQSSLDSAMPPRISVDEFDTEAPSNINDDEMNESTTTLQLHSNGIFTQTSTQLLLLNSLPTRLRILQLLNGLHSELSYSDVLELSSEITEAYRACNTFMNENEQSGVTAFRRNLLDYLLRRFLIPLHCPFAIQARTNALYHYSLKVSLDTALAIISPEPDASFSHLMAIGGGMFREGIRYAIAVITHELLAQVKDQRRDGTLHRNSQYIDLLKKAMKDIDVLSIERIRHGETNIKSHMFLSMIMTQVEAMETDTPYEFKMAQSAKESLDFCHGLLRTRLGSFPLASPNETGFTSTGLDGEHGGFGLDLDMEFFFPDEAFS